MHLRIVALPPHLVTLREEIGESHGGHVIGMIMVHRYIVVRNFVGIIIVIIIARTQATITGKRER